METDKLSFDQKTLTVIGGGAAGFFCAVNAARMNPALKVIILEKTGKLLTKVKVSGGGRCNVTHNCETIAEMIKKYPRGSSFLKKSFHHFFSSDTVKWFRERGVELKTEADGRMFPVTDNSQTIIDCFLNEAEKYRVDIRLHTEISALEKQEDKWILHLKSGVISTDYLCIASGGFPKLAQYEWLKGSAHATGQPVPSLFTFNIPGNPITALPGISVDNAIVKIAGEKLQQTGPLLITHWGMSGPAILKTSAYAARTLAGKNYDFTIMVNWLPEISEAALREKFRELRFSIASRKMVNQNPFHLPSRLWEHFMISSGINKEIRWADLPAKQQNILIKNLSAGEFHVKGKTTFKEEFVTAGGILTEEIDPGSMKSRLHNNLFFAGEILNIDGVTGGYNFQSAWTTGYIAALNFKC